MLRRGSRTYHSRDGVFNKTRSRLWSDDTVGTDPIKISTIVCQPV